MSPGSDDISYIPTDQGWLYLATVIDLGSRRLLGYAMAEVQSVGRTET
jgi:transposase InsO family protein